MKIGFQIPGFLDIRHNIRLFEYPNPTFCISYPIRPESDFLLFDDIRIRLFDIRSITNTYLYISLSDINNHITSNLNIGNLHTLAWPWTSGEVERMLSYFLPRYLCPTAIKGILKACKAPVVSLNSTGAPIPMTPEIWRGNDFRRRLL